MIKYFVMRIVLSVLFIFFTQIFFAQEIVLTGVYNGENIYVMNPSDDFCVTSVYINDSLSKDELHSKAFEISLNLMQLDSGDAVKVKINHKADCKPLVINADIINPANNFKFKTFRVNRNGSVNFSIIGDFGSETIKLQQYRWGKWIVIDEVSELSSNKTDMYYAEAKFHFGENSFRLMHTSETGIDTYSKIVKMRTQNKELKLISSKVSDYLKFSEETFFEIFDEAGVFIRDGYGIEEDVSDLSRGKYWVNYDNKTETFNKK